jgi:hypothetical protein
MSSEWNLAALRYQSMDTIASLSRLRWMKLTWMLEVQRSQRDCALARMVLSGNPLQVLSWQET